MKWPGPQRGDVWQTALDHGVTLPPGEAPTPLLPFAPPRALSRRSHEIHGNHRGERSRRQGRRIQVAEVRNLVATARRSLPRPGWAEVELP